MLTWGGFKRNSVRGKLVLTGRGGKIYIQMAFRGEKSVTYEKTLGFFKKALTKCTRVWIANI